MGSHRVRVLEPTNTCCTFLRTCCTQFLSLSLPLCTFSLPKLRQTLTEHKMNHRQPDELAERRYPGTEGHSNTSWNASSSSVLERALPQNRTRVTLPSFESFCKTVEQLDGPTPPGVGEPAVTATTSVMDNSPTTVHTCHATAVTASAPSSLPNSTPSSPRFTVIADQVITEVHGDKFPSNPRERALAAKEIINHHFGHWTWSDMAHIKANLDSNRPLYGSDKQVSNRGPKSTKKHSMKERGRRDDHSIMFREQNRRMPTQVMELAGYPAGSRKPPGKNHLHVAGVMMAEFDCLIQAKMEQEIHRLQAKLDGSEGTEHYLSFNRRPSCTSSCGSPRKRKRDDDGSMPPPLSPSTSSRSSHGHFSPRSCTPLSSSATW
jgi:hypothetical protein